MSMLRRSQLEEASAVLLGSYNGGPDAADDDGPDFLGLPAPVGMRRPLERERAAKWACV